MAAKARAMGQARRYAGLTASQGLAAGLTYRADQAVPSLQSSAATEREVEAAFAAVAALRHALAERAGDVRQVAVAVLEHMAGSRAARPAGDFILIRRDVAAADLIELAEDGLVGAASVSGGASSHAAIVARG